MHNSVLIEKTVEITIAKMSNPNLSAVTLNGENVASFMQKIYDKLVELNNAETN